eukprot:m.69059 g.69059  ORF g.69059 m.69059 type:complete len:55 (+) comp14106_c0_seq2:421-585(+)
MPHSTQIANHTLPFAASVRKAVSKPVRAAPYLQTPESIGAIASNPFLLSPTSNP